MAVISISGSSFNSFASRTQADTYMKARIGSPEWDAATTTVKNQALVTATRWALRILQRLTDETLIPDPADDPSPTPTPTLILEATIELAYALVVDSSIQDQASPTSDNNKVLQAGSARIERFKPVSGTSLPTIAQQLLNEWISDVGGTTVTGLVVSGVDGVSCFADIDAWGYSEGLP